MNREIINVKLVEEDGTDYLVFYFADDDLFKLNLNSEESQNELKKLFCKLLSRLIENDLSLEFQENKEYSKKLYIDIFEEYISDLNKEITQVREKIRIE